MKLLGEKIKNVSIRPVVSELGERQELAVEPKTAMVFWQSEWQDKFHQVYVNGRFAGATVDEAQDRLQVALPCGLARIEVFAVEPALADEDMSAELGGYQGIEGRVRISWLRTQGLAVGASLNFYTDYGTGLIDFEKPFNAEPVPVWACGQDKGGFGMARFGASDFGRDCGAAIGFGAGSFGYGEIGIDAESVEWVSGRLNEGWYKFAIEIIEPDGGSEIVEAGEPVYVFNGAEPVESLAVIGFEGNRLVFNVTS